MKPKVTMIKIKPLLSIMSTVLLFLISSASVADEDNADQMQFEKSNVSLNLMASKYDKYNSSALFVGLDYKPDNNKGTVIEFGYELNMFDYTYDGVDYNKFDNLRFGAGHEFTLSDNVNMAPMLGFSINNDIESAATQGYISLEFSYDVSNEFSFVVESNYNFGSNLFEDTASVGIGFRYTPQKKTPTIALSNSKKRTVNNSHFQHEELTSPITNNITDEVFFEENNNRYQLYPYTIQLGAYQSGSIYSFLEENSINAEYIYAKHVNGLNKIYYKGFNTITAARNALVELQYRGIEGWVLNTPK